MLEQILNNFYLGFTGISVLLAIGGWQDAWLFGYMGPENTRRCHLVFTKTLEQDTIPEANRVMLTQKI